LPRVVGLERDAMARIGTDTGYVGRGLAYRPFTCAMPRGRR